MDNVNDDFPLPSEDSLPSTYASTPVQLNTSASDDGIDDNMAFIGVTSPLSYPDEGFTINDDDTTINDGNDDDDTTINDDIEVLAAKACALASVPVPDYTEAFARQDRDGKRRKKNKEKYTTQYYIDKATKRAAKDMDPNSVVLANKTSNILSEFQDYITEIDNESQLSSGKEILEYDGCSGEVMTRSNYGGSIDEEGGVADGLVAREWHYDGCVNKQDGSLTKNRNLYNGGDDYGDDDDRNILSVHSSNKDKRYTLPLLHSKYVKTGIIGVTVLGAFLGTIIALSSGGGKDNTHEDYGQDETGGESPGGLGAFVMTEEDGPNKDNNRPNTAPSAAKSILQDELYAAASTKYALNKFDLPADWTDTAYDSREFCKNKGKYDLCPYDAICPLGPDAAPFGGYTENAMGENKEGEGASWTPIADGNNEWVKLSRESACIKYSDKHDNPPTWGIDGNEGTVSTIWCCGMSPVEVEEEAEEVLTEAELEVYVKVFEDFEPMLHGREDGWEGRTYQDAIQYCSSTEGYEICSYDAICPLGPEHEPLGGYKKNLTDGGSSLWVPNSDGPNAWIGVSAENSCDKYVEELSGEWGIMGGNNELLTQTILCCKGSVLGTGEEAFVYDDMAKKHRPNWYDRSEGWVGQTYKDAVDFCQSRQHLYNLNRGHVLCPYEAYCPMADLDSPLGGVIEDGPNGSWAAISGIPNSWISVGREDTCKIYDVVNGEVPEWGITGIANEEITRNVMCCEALEDDDVGAVDSQEDEDPMTGPEFMLMGYEAAAKKYGPKTYGRDHGWLGETYEEARSFCAAIEGYHICPYEGICPIGPGTEPIGGYRMGGGNDKRLWIPVADSINDWVQVSNSFDTCIRFSTFLADDPNLPEWGIAGDEDATSYVICCAKEVDGFQLAELTYKHAGETYMPRLMDREDGWTGQTYDEAFRFCGGHSGLTLCPYDAICPVGPGAEPLGGFKKEEDGGSWVPILVDGGNDWVQVSKVNACILYTNLYAEAPVWGMTGEGDEEITRHIMCCEDVSNGGKGTTEAKGQVQDQASAQAQGLTQTDAEEESIDKINQDVYSEFRPLLFDRDDGWEGKTYLEAIQFCAREEGHEICPYQAICPLGPNNVPFVGYKGNSNTGPSWVPILDGGNNWVNLSPDNSCIRKNIPYSEQPWGNTFEESKDFMQNILCCKGSMIGTHEEFFLYGREVTKYHPAWYDRDSGWMGQTYDEAVDFCIKTKGLHMCPYEAYCPMSDLDDPLGGLKKDEPKGSWSPLRDAFNSWVSVGTDNTCITYDILNGESPGWGIAGIGNEEITRHIMCCALVGDKGIDGGSQQQVVVTVTSQPSKDPTSAPSPAPTPAPSPAPILATTPPPSIKPTTPPSPMPSNKPTSAPVTSVVATSLEAATTTEGFNSAIKYNPVWYDRSSGWTDQTYDAAFTFCSRQGPDNDVCSYTAICPGGPMKLPYGGSKDEPNGSWAPINEGYNEWVQVSDMQTCVHYKDLNTDNRPMWGMTGEGSEEITRHIACCETDISMGEIAQGTSSSQDVTYKYGPKWYSRDDDWVGKSYEDSLSFCSGKDSAIPCPYEAYCPDGPGSQPIEGSRQEQEAWAAIMDTPNGWVNVGSSSDSCNLYNSLHPTPPLWGLKGYRSGVEAEGAKIKDMTAHIMCCREPPPGDTTTPLQSTVSAPIPIANTKYEQDILDKKHPIWFSRKHGYHGNTHDEAADFCKSIGDMVLCSAETYCPEGNTDLDKPLFLKRDAFEGEQWAPVATTNANAQDKWILVGTLDGESQSTCATFSDVKGMKPNGWNVDDSDPELKENILCCMNPNHLLKEMNFAKDLERIWLGESFGWKGGSHDDAVEFCEKLGNKKLCPYPAYCPHGAGQPVIGGHVEDFNMVGEQWAPVYHESSEHAETNYWVMIGQKYQNSATTCMDNFALEGREPEWGMSNENAVMKNHIMCCSFG